jgi:hypothetical protein
VWEIRAWISWMQLPPAESRRAQAERGLAQLQDFVDASGAEGLRPWLSLAHARWARSADEAARWRRQALAEFEKIGAIGHVERMRAEFAAG